MVNFILYNVIVYLLYTAIDHLFIFLNLYSSPKLGADLFIMPTDADITYIVINVIVSSIGGYYILRKINSYK